MGNTTTAGAVEQLAMARRICAAHYRARARNPKNSYGHEMAHAERLINGDSDDWDCVQTTLAAIIETTAREAALIEAVRGALECLGKPDGYLPDIGAPKTRALQRAFEAYDPHPTFKGY